MISYFQEVHISCGLYVYTLKPWDETNTHLFLLLPLDILALFMKTFVDAHTDPTLKSRRC